MRLIDAEGSELQTQLKFIREAEYQIYGGGSWGFTVKCERAIEYAPTIQPEPAQWVPVTEEPIPDGEYLVTWTSEIQEKPILSIICRYSGVWDCWELQMLGHQDINVLAYMELPEPYKGVTE